MREIKFRAWDGWKMFNVDVLAITPGGWSCGVGFDREGELVPDHGRRGVSLAYQPSIKVMQFTGLCDRNGKEIYEGDIVEVTGTPYYAKRGQVVFNGKEYGLLDANNGFCADFVWEDWERFFEVIGNIYENPELLEVEK